jgi:hypothetical protein
MSQTVRERVTPQDGSALMKKNDGVEREGAEKPQANWKGFVAGVFSGVAKLSGMFASLCFGGNCTC